MAPRGRKAGFYVYRIYDGFETVYVGKGSGRRLENQIRKFSLPGEVIEECASDDHAFEREVYWIAQLRPTMNTVKGGNGGRVKQKAIPAWLKKAQKEYKDFVEDYNSIGPRRYVARFLISRLCEGNCEAFGVSKVELFRIREVANGQRC